MKDAPRRSTRMKTVLPKTSNLSPGEPSRPVTSPAPRKVASIKIEEDTVMDEVPHRALRSNTAISENFVWQLNEPHGTPASPHKVSPTAKDKGKSKATHGNEIPHRSLRSNTVISDDFVWHLDEASGTSSSRKAPRIKIEENTVEDEVPRRSLRSNTAISDDFVWSLDDPDRQSSSRKPPRIKTEEHTTGDEPFHRSLRSNTVISDDFMRNLDEPSRQSSSPEVEIGRAEKGKGKSLYRDETPRRSLRSNTIISDDFMRNLDEPGPRSSRRNELRETTPSPPVHNTTTTPSPSKEAMDCSGDDTISMPSLRDDGSPIRWGENKTPGQSSDALPVPLAVEGTSQTTNAQPARRARAPPPPRDVVDETASCQICAKKFEHSRQLQYVEWLRWRICDDCDQIYGHWRKFRERSWDDPWYAHVRARGMELHLTARAQPAQDTQAIQPAEFAQAQPLQVTWEPFQVTWAAQPAQATQASQSVESAHAQPLQVTWVTQPTQSSRAAQPAASALAQPVQSTWVTQPAQPAQAAQPIDYHFQEVYRAMHPSPPPRDRGPSPSYNYLPAPGLDYPAAMEVDNTTRELEQHRAQVNQMLAQHDMNMDDFNLDDVEVSDADGANQNQSQAQPEEERQAGPEGQYILRQNNNAAWFAFLENAMDM
ncbi:hypothetical protein B0T10DRAFT_559410 [Thelonectria olida]|uniref:Uncharacterized protein n=1 Tax=Thelonectria olida TaxID=1576542 RepID=A0A9P8WBX4_9HYPO|nr:hypothetical protein B0T10DRAFT_559410 [Thelonectria olida]